MSKFSQVVIACAICASTAYGQSDAFDRRMAKAPLVVFGDTFKTLGVERDVVVAASRDFFDPPPDSRPTERVRVKLYTGPQVWLKTQAAVDAVLNPAQQRKFKCYCFQYLVGKSPVSALRYADEEPSKEVAEEINKKSNSLKSELYSQYLIDRMELAVHALRSVIKPEDLRKQIGKPFSWKSRLLDDFWINDPASMPTEALKAIASMHVQRELKMTLDQIGRIPDLSKRWRKIKKNNDGEEEEEQVKLAHQLVDDICEEILTEEQRPRFRELIAQRYLACDDLLMSMQLLKIERPTKRAEKETLRADRKNFHLCLTAVQHLRRYSMRVGLIEDHIDRNVFNRLTRHQFIPHGNRGGVAKIPEAFADLATPAKKTKNPRRGR